jgi:GAF domain-containing protein
VVADATGHITPKQLYPALRLNGWTAELSEVEAMVASVDKDSDARLSFDEFSQLMISALLRDEVRLRVREGGSRHHVISTGELLNVRNVMTDPNIDDESRRRYLLRGYDVKSLLLAPVFDADGEVIGLVELVNKDADAPDPRARPRRLSSGGDGGANISPPASTADMMPRRNSAYGFSKDDERLLTMLCKHCSVFLKHLDSD